MNLFIELSEKSRKMVRVIDKKKIPGNLGDPIVEEITVIERLFFINFKFIYRRINNKIFKYKNDRYKEVSWIYDRDIEGYFLLPVYNGN